MSESFKRPLGELIAARRKALGLTQRDLADRAHIREATTISRWERGERAPNDLDAVALALETTAAEMLAELRAPVSQADRRRLEHGGESQLDRIEQMLALLVYRQGAGASAPAPEGEFGRAAEGSPPTDADPNRRRRRAAGDSR